MKKRVDILLAEKGLTKSREKAKIQIISGNVYANGKQVKNPSDTLDEDATIELRADACPYVSRGGLKLEKALQEFRINLEGKTCADIGASTGGFTDCMLKNGAVFVYAIDVGYGQFDWSLRNDGRVMLMERTNARHLEALEQAVDFTSVDVSFISLKHIFPAVARISEAHAEVVTLIKPQFEAGKGQVGKKGVVRDPKVHTEVIENVISYAEANG
ncbi:MAG: TlyA family RNA methyltransferase, partial [Christensenellaceae bacterium]